MNSSDGSTDGTVSRQAQADAFFTAERDEATVARLKEERILHDAEADAFFAGRWSTERLDRLLDEWGTPQVLLDRWARDCERARVVDAGIWGAIRQREAAEQRRAAAERDARERTRAVERSKQWAQAHPERTEETKRRWEENNRERRRQISRDYYLRNRDKVLQRQRERNQIDPSIRAAHRRRYAEEHPERVAESNRKWRADPQNAERHQAATQRWKQRERRRIEVGLPPRRIRRLTPDQKRALEAEADEFFHRHWSGSTIRRMRHQVSGGPTPPELLAAFKADCARARHQSLLANNPFYRARVERERERHDADERETQRVAREDARMDAIARVINDRLRRTPRRTDQQRADAAAPIEVPRSPDPGGLGRWVSAASRVT